MKSVFTWKQSGDSDQLTLTTVISWPVKKNAPKFVNAAGDAVISISISVVLQS